MDSENSHFKFILSFLCDFWSHPHYIQFLTIDFINFLWNLPERNSNEIRKQTCRRWPIKPKAAMCKINQIVFFKSTSWSGDGRGGCIKST